MRPILLALCLTLSLGITGTSQAQTFSTLEERMSAADFQRAGLNKLSPEELAKLNAWLQRDTAPPADAPTAPPVETDRRGFQQGGPFDDDTGMQIIRSSVSGEFRGWSAAGDLITLANGQVWRVTDGDTQLRVNLTDPVVILRRGFFGGWTLAVDGYNTRARVVRVR